MTSEQDSSQPVEQSVDFARLPKSVYSALVPFDCAQWAPPESLPPERAFENYIRYRKTYDGSKEKTPSAFLGNLVVPILNIGSLARVLDRHPGITIPVSLLCPENMETIPFQSILDQFYRQYGTYGYDGRNPRYSASISAIELPYMRSSDAHRVLGAMTERVANEWADSPQTMLRPKVPNIYVEIDPSLVEDYRTAPDVHLKIRLGGGKIPPANRVAHFLTICAERGKRFKAEGLHKPFTSETGYGYVNVTIASLGAVLGETEQAVLDILLERSPQAFRFSGEGIMSECVTVSSDTLKMLRSKHYSELGLLSSIGTCSFEEPMQGLSQLSTWS